MYIARHWIREEAIAQDKDGRKHKGMAWGWSADSVEEARQRARASAQQVADWIAAGGRAQAEPPRSFQYQYNVDRPPREEIVQELRDGAGETSALITRNALGVLVLNTSQLMFIDVDVPRTKARSGGLLAMVFGKKRVAEPQADAALQRMRQWCAGHPEFGVRIYQTAAGYRAAIIDRPMQADSDASRSILAGMGSDPLYGRLCEAQRCYRARLTPKPWRMGLRRPEGRFPFPDAEAERRFRQWQREYDAAAPRFATCRLLESHGPAGADRGLAGLVELHDKLTGVDREVPLA